MNSRQWHFKVRPVRNSVLGEYIAWCSQTPNLGNGPLEIPASEDVYFEFGPTEAEALRKLMAEVLQ